MRERIRKDSAAGGALRRRGGWVAAMSVAAILMLLAPVARAEAPRLVPYGTFPTEGGLGVAVDNSCALHAPPLTGSPCTELDPSADDVFTTGFIELNEEGGFLGLGISQKFNAVGKSISPPSPFGNGLDYGAAVNPVNGDLYVAHAPTHEIGIYDPDTGALLSSFPVAEFGELTFAGFAPVGIAADSAGNVYVPSEPNHEVLEYDPTTCVKEKEEKETKGEEITPCEPLKMFTGGGTLGGPRGVAVDPSGDLWVADATAGRIEELGPADAVMKMIDSEGVQALALDSHGDVFATTNGAGSCGSLEAPCVHLVEYGPLGGQLADVGAGDLGSPARAVHFPSMVSVDDFTERVYVTDMGKNEVWIFGPPSVPVIDSQFTAEVGTSQAKLGALVNPGGINTTYRFEYGLTESYGQSTPSPEGSVGEGVSSRTVWAEAKGLAPGTTYHYRIVVANALGERVGGDRTFTTATAAESSCLQNEQLRTGFSASLPDCRAYELITPANNASAQPDTNHIPNYKLPAAEGGGIAGNQAARDGARMSYVSEEVLPGSASVGLEYVSTRGVAGWSAENVVPLASYTGDRCTNKETVPAFSADLSKELVEHPSGTPDRCGVELVEVVPGEPRGVINLLLRDNTTRSYGLVDLTPPGVTPEEPHFLGASADLGHVVFAERAPLVSGVPTGVEDVYEWSDGSVRLVTILPDGTAVAGSFAGISADGSVVLFTATGNLYARLDGQRTVQVDATQGPGAGGGGAGPHLTADGSSVFFADDSPLTADSTAQAGEPDLYQCRIVEVEEAGKREPACDLKDLTVASGSEHANVGEAVFSEDGSYLYFTATAVLADNTREYTGVNGEPALEKALAGERNLYVEHEGTVVFIATGVGPAQGGLRFAQASPDGRSLTFTSTRPLTGYQNIDRETEKPDREIFIYSAAGGELSCVSCKPSGEPPTTGGAFTPRATVSANQGAVHYVFDGDRLFFQTAEALLPADTNGKFDVYEYEAGQLHLISTGTSSGDSYLLEASDNGQDVFFLTRQKLLPQDTNEEALSIYDARVDGGFAESASPPGCTTPEACRGASVAQPSIFGAPASQTFSGPGNLTPATPASPAKPKTPTRAQLLAKALKACRKKHNPHKRLACEKQAHKRYPSKSSKGRK